MTIPKVFVSYSHDSQPHKKWVMDFATRLRNSGVDAILDQWELQPGDDIPLFMERNLSSADRVLMVCTENYVKKANSGAGGVGYEKMIVTADLMRSIDSNKVIPIIRQQGGYLVPTFLASKYFIDFSRDDNSEFSYDELIRTLVGAPLFVKPQIGNNPFTPVASTPVQRSADTVRELMALVVSQFEQHSFRFVLYKKVVAESRMSRILLDIAIAQAIQDGLITTDTSGDLYLTDSGKHYAIANKMV